MELRKPSILLVDDDHSVLNTLRCFLAPMTPRWSVRCASDPSQALALIKNDPADVVITDLRMPDIDGLELIARMRDVASNEATYMVLTGSQDFDTAVEAINSGGVFRFFHKSSPPTKLVEAIESALTHRAKQSEASTPAGSDASKLGSAALGALEMLAPAFIVIGGHGKLVHANQSASTLLAAKDGISVDAGQVCRASTSKHSKKLQEAITSIASSPHPEARFLSLPRQNGKADLTVMLIRPEGLAGNDTPLVVAIITAPEGAPTPSPAALVSLFRLTPAEAQIAHTIAAGLSIDEAASGSGITVQSARTYLKRIYAKLGISRQVELAKLVLSSPAALTMIDPR